MKNPTVYCQNCRASNSLNDTNCVECGTRLLLVVFPNSLQYETNQTPSYYEDHLLERVSLLELRQTQMSEALQGVVEVLREQSEILKDERDLIKDLYGILGLLKSGGADRLHKFLENLPERENKSEAAPVPSDAEQERILGWRGVENPELLARLFAESRRLLDDGNERQGFRMIERALAVSPGNPALNVYYARELFLAERFGKAAEVADLALVVVPDDRRALLLSGAAHAELANLEQARRNLSLLVNDGPSAGIVNFVWGMLAASQGNWTEAIAAFKQSSPAAVAEIEFLIGCSYFQLQRYRMALRHLITAVKLDRNYKDAWFLQSVIYKLQGDEAAESDALGRARTARDPASQCQEFLRGRNLLRVDTAPPFRHFGSRKKALVSGGSTRIRKLYRGLMIAALSLN